MWLQLLWVTHSPCRKSDKSNGYPPPPRRLCYWLHELLEKERLWTVFGIFSVSTVCSWASPENSYSRKLPLTVVIWDTATLPQATRQSLPLFKGLISCIIDTTCEEFSCQPVRCCVHGNGLGKHSLKYQGNFSQILEHPFIWVPK